MCLGLDDAATISKHIALSIIILPIVQMVLHTYIVVMYSQEKILLGADCLDNEKRMNCKIIQCRENPELFFTISGTIGREGEHFYLPRIVQSVIEPGMSVTKAASSFVDKFNKEVAGSLENILAEHPEQRKQIIENDKGNLAKLTFVGIENNRAGVCRLEMGVYEVNDVAVKALARPKRWGDVVNQLGWTIFFMGSEQALRSACLENPIQKNGEEVNVIERWITAAKIEKNEPHVITNPISILSISNDRICWLRNDKDNCPPIRSMRRNKDTTEDALGL